MNKINADNINASLFKEDMTSLWTPQTFDDAARRFQFIMVTPPGPSRVYIIDAQRIWMNNPAIVFHTGYRIAGIPDDISASLSSSGVSQEDINNILESVITYDNYQHEMSQGYSDEISSYNTWTRSSLKTNHDSPGVKLFDIMTNINPEVLTKTATATMKQLPAAKGRKTKSLYERLASLPQGKVLDVSKLTADGTGATSIAPPTGRSKKYGSPNLPMVSSDLEHYILAINMLPGGVEKYEQDVNYVRQMFSQLQGALLTLPTITAPAVSPVVPGLVPVVPGAPVATPTLTPALSETTAFSPHFAPVLQGTAIPQTEDVVPTPVYPMYTKRQRAKIKASTPVTTLFPTQQTIMTPTQTAMPFFPTQQTPTLFPTQQPARSPSVPLVPTIPTQQPVRSPTVPTVPLFPTIPTQQTVRSPTVPTVPLVPTVPTQQTVRSPTLPTVPLFPTQQPVGSPTVPTVPLLPTIPTQQPVRSPTVPTIPTQQQVVTNPLLPQAQAPLPLIPVITQQQTPTPQRTPTMPTINIPGL